MKTWAKAITATARKRAILVYRTLKDGLVYRDPDVANNSIQPTALRAAV